MNNSQKEAIKILLDGGSISHTGGYGIRLRNKNLEAVRRITQPSFEGLKDFIKKEKNLWVINKSAFRGRDEDGQLKLHGKSWAKKYYKQFLKKKKDGIL